MVAAGESRLPAGEGRVPFADARDVAAVGVAATAAGGPVTGPPALTHRKVAARTESARHHGP